MKRSHIRGWITLLLLTGCSAAAPPSPEANGTPARGREASGKGVAVEAGVELEAASLVIDYEYASQLPQRAPELTGGFLEQAGDTYVVGSGFVHIHPDENGQFVTDHDGPRVTVKVSNETRFYRDVTVVAAANHVAEEASLTVAQEVAEIARPASISPPAFITIWGQRQGDALVAEVILLGQPQ